MLKEQLTRDIITELDMDVDLDEAVNKWWVTKTDNNLRLSFQGFKVLSPISQHCTFSLILQTQPIALGTLLKLGKLNTPFYIHFKKGIHVSIFSSKISTIISLYKDLDHYLDTLN